MKYILMLTVLGFLSACDPVTYTTYKVVNDTEVEGELIFYSMGEESQRYTLSSRGSVLLMDGTEALSSEPTGLDFSESDSIYTVFSQKQKIIFYPDSSTLPSGKNIYDIESDWKRENDDNNYKYTFHVTEEDIADLLE